MSKIDVMNNMSERVFYDAHSECVAGEFGASKEVSDILFPALTECIYNSDHKISHEAAADNVCFTRSFHGVGHSVAEWRPE